MVQLSACGQCVSYQSTNILRIPCDTLRASKVRSFKYTAHILALRHQYLEMYIATQVSGENIVTIGCRFILFERLPEMVRLPIVENGLAQDNVVALKSITNDGFLYSEGSATAHIVIQDDHPGFVQVCKLFCVHRNILVLAQPLETIEFNQHFRLYVAHVTTEYVVLDDLHDFQTEPLFVKKRSHSSDGERGWRGGKCSFSLALSFKCPSLTLARGAPTCTLRF